MKLATDQDNIPIAKVIHGVMKCDADELPDDDVEKILTIADRSYQIGLLRGMGMGIGEANMAENNHLACLN